MGSIAKWRGQKKNLSDLEDKTIEMSQTEQQRDHRLKKNGSILKNLWNYNKRSNVHVIGTLGQEKEDGAKKKILNLAKCINLQIQEAE